MVFAQQPRGITSADTPLVAKTLDLLDPAMKMVVDYLVRFYDARTIQENQEVMRHFADNVTLDLPPVFVSGKSKVLSIWFFGKRVFKFELVPSLVRIRNPDNDHLEVAVDGVLKFQLVRTWLVPLTYLVPEISFDATVTLLFRKDDKITYIRERLHNFFSVFTPFRATLGFACGTIGQLTEPLWVSLFDGTLKERALKLVNMASSMCW